MKIVTIVGARPQFIKAAVVSRAFREHRPAVREVLVPTGQHYDANMSDVFFAELDIRRPDYNLGIGGGTHGQNTGRILEAIEGMLFQEQPDRVLVFGDTIGPRIPTIRSGCATSWPALPSRSSSSSGRCTRALANAWRISG